MVKYFPGYLITTAKHAVKIEPIKYLESTCLFISFFYVQKKQTICDKIAFFIFYINTFQRKKILNSREDVHFLLHYCYM